MYAQVLQEILNTTKKGKKKMTEISGRYVRRDIKITGFMASLIVLFQSNGF